jgi:hypothetical protein
MGTTGWAASQPADSSDLGRLLPLGGKRRGEERGSEAERLGRLSNHYAYSFPCTSTSPRSGLYT